ncbi:MAG: ABC transporter permease [Marinifilaceae bacterium]
MLWYNLKRAIRSLLKNKLNSIINIFGLAVGMSAVILIFIYVQHELSYDKFNEKHERIYRIASKFDKESSNVSSICIRLDEDNFGSKLPEVEEVTQLFRGWNPDIEVEGKHYREFQIHSVDTNFHRVFTLNFLYGNSKQLFKNPQSVALTQSTAKKLFGNKNPIGKTIQKSGALFSVSAVVEDLPKTSHYNFDILVPLQASKNYKHFHEYGLEFFTYVLFKEDVTLGKAVPKAEALYQKLLANRFNQYGYNTSGYLEKLTDIHLRSNSKPNLRPGGNIKTVYIQIFLALLILIIAIVNFINIMTVQYEGKAKEIGLQKAIGASRKELIRQFLGNSILLSFASLLVGIILAEAMLPFFSHMLNRELEIDYLHNPYLTLGLPLLALLVGFLSGIYPAFFVSRYSPATVIKGIIHRSGGTNRLTRILVIFQFSVSLILLINMVILSQQISFMKNADLGFQTEKVIAISNLNSKLRKAYPAIKEELLKNPSIEIVSISDHRPGGGTSGQGFYLVGQTEKETKHIDEYRVEPGYFEALNIQFLQGRSFSDKHASDSLGIILNEKAVEYFKLEHPVGQEVWFHGRKHHIQGVVRNFNYQSLRSEISPLMFSRSWYRNYIIVKSNNANLKEELEYIQNTLQKFDPSYILGYTFIDDFCKSKYRKEERSQSLTLCASALSIILALLGLYALSLYMVNKRTKEIGIRKVNGASILQISGLLLTSMTKWIAIAFCIAAPVSWWLMNNWLENFAYRIKIGLLPFLIAGSIAFLFALLTVGWQTWRAASRNPVEALKYE